MTVEKVKKLNNGYEMPALGFGTFLMQDPEVCKLSVAAAIGAGYRMIDTAAQYRNEVAVGEGIRMSGIAREDIFVTTKVWLQYCGYENVRTGLENSLKRLGMDYVDLYLIHWPFVDPVGTWKAMEELVEEGKIKSIGVCNFSIDQMKELLANCKIKPVVNQVETHIINQQKELKAFLEENDIILEAWGSLGRGNARTMGNEVVTELAEKYGKTAAQIQLRWALQEGYIVIPKSTSVARICENNRVWDFEISEEDMDKIRAVDTGLRMVSKTDPESEAARQRLINMVFDI